MKALPHSLFPARSVRIHPGPRPSGALPALQGALLLRLYLAHARSAGSRRLEARADSALPRLARQLRVSVDELAEALRALELRGWVDAQRLRLSLPGLALAVALKAAQREVARRSSASGEIAQGEWVAQAKAARTASPAGSAAASSPPRSGRANGPRSARAKKWANAA